MELFKLLGTIAISNSEANKEIDETTGKAEKSSSKIGSAFKKIGAAVITYLSVDKIRQFGQSCINAYADYEQLVGGSQLLFGNAYEYIAEKAKNAYSTVQLSQNEYLKQVNGFATGLKTSLGGNEQAAAELADRIVNAEADIVAATGNSQENIQNAFNRNNEI